jgi:serine/threonine protein phosphatase PrpC
MVFWKRRRQTTVTPPSEKVRKGMAFGVASDVGRVRPANQDHVFAQQTSLPGPNGQVTVGLFIVADGMGGHTGGSAASERAVEVVVTEVLQGLLLPVLRGEPPPAIQDLMRDAVLRANRRILEEATQQRNDMGTTMTAGLLLAGRCYLAHVGDSRLYSYGAGGLQCRTRDHSMVARLLELGQISPEEAHRHPKRNYLYQSVGQQEDIEVEVSSFALDDCSHLLLCCDGLWGMVEEDVLGTALASEDEPQDVCDQLVARANQAGGEDNISVIVVALPQQATQSR